MARKLDLQHIGVAYGAVVREQCQAGQGNGEDPSRCRACKETSHSRVDEALRSCMYGAFSFFSYLFFFSFFLFT